MFDTDDIVAPPVPAAVREDTDERVDVSTREGLERLLDMFVRADHPPAERAGLGITAFARLVTTEENLKTIRLLTRVYEIYRASLSGRLKLFAMLKLAETGEGIYCETLAQARAADVERKSCTDLLRNQEIAPLLGRPPRARRQRKQKRKERRADGARGAGSRPNGAVCGAGSSANGTVRGGNADEASDVMRAVRPAARSVNGAGRRGDRISRISETDPAAKGGSGTDNNAERNGGRFSLRTEIDFAAKDGSGSVNGAVSAGRAAGVPARCRDPDSS